MERWRQDGNPAIQKRLLTFRPSELCFENLLGKMSLVLQDFRKMGWFRGELRFALQGAILLCAVLPYVHSQEIPVGFTVERYARVWEQNPFTLAKAAVTQRQPSIFEKLFLASWLIEGGKEVIYVENFETKEVQRISIEPNENNIRLLGMNLNPNPRLVEAVISDGKEKGTVKFRYDDQLSFGSAISTLAQVPIDFASSQARNPDVPGEHSSALQETAPADQAPASRIYPGVPRVNMEGGPRQGASRAPGFGRKYILPDSVPAPSKVRPKSGASQ